MVPSKLFVAKNGTNSILIALMNKYRKNSWALLAVKIEISMNRLATFHKVGPGRGEHDGEKSFRIGSLICPAVRTRSYAKMSVAQEGRRDFCTG